MRIEYDTEEALDFIKVLAGKYFEGYEITKLSFDKWDGLKIEAEKMKQPVRPVTPPPGVDYRPTSEADMDDNIPL